MTAFAFKRCLYYERWDQYQSFLPLWDIYYINGIDTFLEKKCGNSDHFIIISIKNTCAEVYIIHWNMLAPFEDNSLEQQLQLKHFPYRSTKWSICN